MTTNVRAEGPGSIAIGGDVINSIFVTGGVNQFFVGRYERLAEAYVNPRALYRELRLDQFTGREWLVSAIDEFVSGHDRGYVVIEAEAGMGKTAFMAWLARERGYAHHFVRLMPDADDIGAALRNLAAQLIRAWDLQALAVGGVLPANAGRPDFFEDVLYEAAARRDELRPGEPIVITVDGLNETTPPPGQNPLALPAELPDGVYFVVSQRTVLMPLAVTTPRRVLRIRRDGPENLADLRAYMRVVVAEPVLAARLAEVGIAAEDYVRRLVAWSAGVWLVLRYVLAELRSGTRALDDLESLPAGLWQYYAQYWSRWQGSHNATWATVDRPLLVTLTAVQEPLSLDLLCALSGCADAERAATLVSDAWRPFLEVVADDDGERYAAFHDSLREFVAGRVDPGALTSAEGPFVERLAAAQRAAQERIATRYLDAWGGLDDGLPALRGAAADLDEGYGLRHVVHHLAAATADALLHRLLALEWPEAANAWFEAHRARHAYAGYLLDIRRAWARAERARDLALELRYALIAASVNSIAGNVPSELLLLLIGHGALTAGQALELARECTDPRTRAEALTALLPLLTGEIRDEVVREALASVQAVPDGYWRAGELVRLAPVAGPGYEDDLRTIAAAMTKPYERDISLRFLASELVLPQVASWTYSFNPVDPHVFAAQYLQRTRRAVSTLLQGVAVDLDGELDARRHVEASAFVRDPRWRAELLTAAAQTAPAAARGEILTAALGLALQAGDHEARDTALAAIAARLAASGDVPAALDCVTAIPDLEGLTRVFFAVAVAAPPGARDEMMAQALDAAGRIGDPIARSQVLCDHAAQLTPGRALDSLLSSLPVEWGASVRAAMPGLPIDELPDIVLVLAAAGRDLDGVVDQIPDAFLPRVAEAFRALDDPEVRDHALAALPSGAPDGDDYWLLAARYRAARAEVDATSVAATVTAAPLRAEALTLTGHLALAFALADAASGPSERIAVLLRIADAAFAQTSPHAIAEANGGAQVGLRAAEAARVALSEVSEAGLRASLAGAVGLALARCGAPAAALDVVRELPEHPRAVAVVPLAGHLGDAVTEAADLGRALRDPADRGRVLAALAGPLAAVCPEALPAHLRAALHDLALGTRAGLLEAVPDLLPGLMELAGQRCLGDLGAAITLAQRWWP